MTDPLKIVEPIPTLLEQLAAGRRAALATLSQTTDNRGDGTPETYKGEAPLLVNGIDIGPGIDAAVMETIIRPELRAAFPAPVVEARLVADLEYLLAEAKAGRIRAGAWCFVTEESEQRIGHSWFCAGGRQWALTAAIDRLAHFWRKDRYA